MEGNGLPIEVGIERAKREIVAIINQIGIKYSIPSSILFMIVEDILNSSKISTYTTIIANYNLSQPSENEAQKSTSSADNEAKNDNS